MSSQSVPQVFDHNCEEINPPFLWIVEQFIEGQTLRYYLKNGKKYATEDVVSFIGTMLNIAIATEKLKIVHRDIKPENIIVSNLGDFWLLDFGIARHLDLESLTQTDSPYGLFTLGYASSEQFRNLKKDIDIRTDLFSIGVVAFEMLTGSNPFRQGTNDPIMILKRMENLNLPPLKILGDTQFQLSGFISLIGDIRRTRRPASADMAKRIFDNVKQTLKL